MARGNSRRGPGRGARQQVPGAEPPRPPRTQAEGPALTSSPAPCFWDDPESEEALGRRCKAEVETRGERRGCLERKREGSNFADVPRAGKREEALYGSRRISSEDAVGDVFPFQPRGRVKEAGGGQPLVRGGRRRVEKTEALLRGKGGRGLPSEVGLHGGGRRKP